MSIEKSKFGQMKDGNEVFVYSITNNSGMVVKVLEYGAIITSILVPDKNGRVDDVVLGYDSLDEYENNSCFFGATIGRSANRVAGGRFMLDGKEIQMPKNEGKNNLHTDRTLGFDKRLWASAVDNANNAVEMSLESLDGEAGLPGNLKMKVRFSLNDENELRIEYSGVSDKTTVINCTNHSYFNLGGHKSGQILNEFMEIKASRYTPVDSESIPTGELAEVNASVFDFRSMKKIGDEIDNDEQQLKYVGGYDHNFCLDGFDEKHVFLAAAVEDRESGRRMEVYTDLPGIQFYSGNFISSDMRGKDGAVYGPRMGFCLETQYYPDSVNKDNFKKPIFKAGETSDSTTVYKFLCRT